MAVLLTALCVNFTSCSDDEEGGGSNSGSVTKRLVGMEVTYHGEKIEFSLEYGDQGRASKMVVFYDEDGITFTTLYTYNGNEVTVTQTWEYPYETDDRRVRNFEDVYQLNDKGYVVEGFGNTPRYSFVCRNWTASFEYVDDYLVSIKATSECEDDEPQINSSKSEVHQLLTDGKILPDSWSTIEYTDIPNKGGLFYMYSDYIEIFEEFEWYELYFANLAGKAPKYLPKSADNTVYDYELDDEGYVKSFTLTDGDLVTSVKCTYENI